MTSFDWCAYTHCDSLHRSSLTGTVFFNIGFHSARCLFFCFSKFFPLFYFQPSSQTRVEWMTRWSLLFGPTDVGKSSLSKILCNYAVRKGWNPLFVDLDLGQGGITCPGTVGAVPVDRPVDVSEVRGSSNSQHVHTTTRNGALTRRFCPVNAQ